MPVGMVAVLFCHEEPPPLFWPMTLTSMFTLLELEISIGVSLDAVFWLLLPMFELELEPELDDDEEVPPDIWDEPE